MVSQRESMIHPRMTKKPITYHHQQTKTESSELTLTEREKEILFDLVKGLSNSEIYLSLTRPLKFTSISSSKEKCKKTLTGSHFCCTAST